MSASALMTLAAVTYVIFSLYPLPILALYSLVWIPIFAGICAAEERELVIRYGEMYEEYRARTGFLLPQER